MVSTVTEESSQPDVRCLNPSCELYKLRLERDEVAPVPGDQPDRCASCGHPLGEYAGN